MRLQVRLLPPLAAAALLAAPVPAQDTGLARIDSLLDRGRFTEAGNTLARWQAGPDANRGTDDVAHALLLRGRLATRADTALAAYLELALAHPSSRFAPAALLRLGQGHAALGQHERAAGYLQRLVRDYPGFSQRPLALLWLSRSQRAGRLPVSACAELRTAATAADPDLRPLLQRESDACAAPTAPRAENAATAEAPGPYTVQAGAFRDPAAAQALARRLADQGINARVVFVGTGTLAQVRAGRFATPAAASSLLRRVRQLVPSAILAADAPRERPASR